MSEGLTREHVNSRDSQEFATSGFFSVDEAEPALMRGQLAGAALFANLAEPDGRTNDAASKGACRAAISPPTVPLGDAPDADMDDETVSNCKDAVTTLTTSSTTPALKFKGAESDEHPSGQGNFSDIVVCEGSAARLAMLDLRLPSRIGRRASRSMQRAAVGCATEQDTARSGARADGAVESALDSMSRPMPELPARGEISKLGARRGGGLPKRIGSGMLVPAKLTWMPKDPFGAGVQEKAVSRFRWELMLTSACVTAVSVLAVLWLLKTVAA